MGDFNPKQAVQSLKSVCLDISPLVVFLGSLVASIVELPTEHPLPLSLCADTKKSFWLEFAASQLLRLSLCVGESTCVIKPFKTKAPKKQWNEICHIRVHIYRTHSPFRLSRWVVCSVLRLDELTPSSQAGNRQTLNTSCCLPDDPA